MTNSKLILILIIIALASVLLLGADVQYVDTAGRGSPMVQPQVVEAVPAQPYACAAAHRGRLLYVDDTNDTAEAYLCFCGVDADDTTYIWLKVQDPAVNCF